MDLSIISNTSDVIRSGREAEELRCVAVRVLALVDTTAPRSLVLPVRDAFDPRMPTAEVRVVGVGEDIDLLAPAPPDVCVAVLGRDGAGMSAGICELAAAGVPVAVVAESALDVPALPLGQTAARRVSILAASNGEVLVDRLAEWLVDATDKDIAFAANFPFCRKAKVRQLVKEYAVENAAVSAKAGPRGDPASLALNQARLALDIAAINGQPLALGRVPEVLSAIAAGAGSRAVANKSLGKVPLVGRLFQAGLGYLGTQATGMTLQRRFDKREQRASGAKPERASVARRAAEGVRALAGHRTGGAVRSSAAGSVKMLPSTQDGGHLVYEQEDVR